MLVREVLERTFSLLEPKFTWDKLAAAVTTTDPTTITLSGRIQSIPRDGTVEFEDDSMEVALVESSSTASATLYNRGHLESTPATHLAGTRVLIDNPHHRIELFNTLKGVIGQLRSAGLHRVTYSPALTYSSSTPVTLPAGATDSLSSIWVKHGQRYQELRRGREFQVLKGFTPPKLQFFYGGYEGAELHTGYVSDITTPTAITDDLDTLGVPAGLQPHLPLGVAGHVLLTKELPEIESESIKRVVSQASPVGSRVNVGRALLGQFDMHVAAERTRLIQDHPPAIVYS